MRVGRCSSELSSHKLQVTSYDLGGDSFRKPSISLDDKVGLNRWSTPPRLAASDSNAILAPAMTRSPDSLTMLRSRLFRSRCT